MIIFFPLRLEITFRKSPSRMRSREISVLICLLERRPAVRKHRKRPCLLRKDEFRWAEKRANSEEWSAFIAVRSAFPRERPAFPRKKPAFPRKKSAFPRRKLAFPRRKPAFLRKKPAFPRRKPAFPRKKPAFLCKKWRSAMRKCRSPHKKPIAAMRKRRLERRKSQAEKNRLQSEIVCLYNSDSQSRVLDDGCVSRGVPNASLEPCFWHFLHLAPAHLHNCI